MALQLHHSISKEENKVFPLIPYVVCLLSRKKHHFKK
jgi:hypothetical protein